jgi:molybdate transport system substrate-binding protein
MSIRVLRELAVGALLLVASSALGADLVVFAAASLTDSLQQATDEYTAASGNKVKLSFAASSALAKQIQNGAGADVFLAADQEWMDYLAAKDLIRQNSRQNLLGNRLVLIAPADSKVALRLGPGAKLLDALGAQGRLATGEPSTVPAGKYAQAALTSLGIWAQLEPRLARAENVRAALSYVARGEAPLGIVYATDAAVEPKVRIVDTFAEATHPAITYPMAATKAASAAAAGYLKFLQGPAAAAIFSKAGFTVLGRSQAAMVSGCSGFAFDLSNEIGSLSSRRFSLTAAASGRGPLLPIGTGHTVTLADQTKVKFAVPPGKEPTQPPSHAGILRLAPDPRTTVRVTLNAPAWIDLVAAGKAVGSTRHTGSTDCQRVHKSVEFTVQPDMPLVLQLSGAAAATIGVVITRY